MADPRTIAVVGAPGAGKSTVGQLLAERLSLPFVDVDVLIEREQGRLIREIFADFGEPRFRELEREATLRALGGPGVVSLGGGAVMNPAIREALRGLAVIWLQVSVTKATRRVGLNAVRPLLLGDVRARLTHLLAERQPFYEAVATMVVDTDVRGPDAVVDEILARLAEEPR